MRQANGRHFAGPHLSQYAFPSSRAVADAAHLHTGQGNPGSLQLVVMAAEAVACDCFLRTRGGVRRMGRGWDRLAEQGHCPSHATEQETHRKAAFTRPSLASYHPSMLPRSASFLFLYGLLLTGSAPLLADGPSLFDAVIRHDQKTVLALLKGGANPNQ